MNERMTGLGFLMLTVMAFSAVIFVPGKAHAADRKAMCHDLCYAKHPTYDKIVILSPAPMVEFACVCQSRSGKVLGAYGRMGNSWNPFPGPISIIEGMLGSGDSDSRVEPIEDPGKGKGHGDDETVDVQPKKPTPPLPTEEKKERFVEFEMFAGAGLNACLKSGDARCTDMDPLVDIIVAPGIRLGGHYGIFLDMNFGWLNWSSSTVADEEVRTLSVIPTFRYFFTFDVFEIFAGIGVGYSRRVSEFMYQGEPVTVTESSFFNPKLNIGMAFNVADPLSIGFSLDYLFNINGAGEYCVKNGDNVEQCKDRDEWGSEVGVPEDITDLLMFNIIFKLKF